MLQVDVSASKRDSFGKGAMRRLRLDGKTPAVLYGNKKDTLSLQLDTAPLLKSLFKISRKNAVVNLSIDGNETRHVMMREIQTDPVDDRLIHADFWEIDLNQPKSFVVKIEYAGKAKGVERGGEMVIHHSSVSLLGMPLDIPDVIKVNVSGMDIGKRITFGDIELPANVKMNSKDSTVSVEIVAPQVAASTVEDTKGKKKKK